MLRALEESSDLIRPPDTLIYNRKKDQGSATGDWFSELVKPNPWYKDVVPDVRPAKTELSRYMLTISTVSTHFSGRIER